MINKTSLYMFRKIKIRFHKLTIKKTFFTNTDHTFLVQFTVKRNALSGSGLEEGVFVWLKVGCVSKGRS